jgi:transcriptional regulator with XRE-family HTH domain
MCIDVGNKIRKLRLSKGYSQEFMANNLGVSQKTYSRLENNESKCDINRLAKIANLLVVEVDFFINGKVINRVDVLNEEIIFLKKVINLLLEKNIK